MDRDPAKRFSVTGTEVGTITGDENVAVQVRRCDDDWAILRRKPIDIFEFGRRRMKGIYMQ